MKCRESSMTALAISRAFASVYSYSRRTSLVLSDGVLVDRVAVLESLGGERYSRTSLKDRHHETFHLLARCLHVETKGTQPEVHEDRRKALVPSLKIWAQVIALAR